MLLLPISTRTMVAVTMSPATMAVARVRAERRATRADMATRAEIATRVEIATRAPRAVRAEIRATRAGAERARAETARGALSATKQQARMNPQVRVPEESELLPPPAALPLANRGIEIAVENKSKGGKGKGRNVTIKDSNGGKDGEGGMVRSVRDDLKNTMIIRVSRIIMFMKKSETILNT